MASITKSPKGYRAQVYLKGVRDSQVFRTKREAEAWGAARELVKQQNVKMILPSPLAMTQGNTNFN